ncbi:hypothetical protein [Sphingomonas aracearum]|uniref:hypothetical protein n=1 Tax=Sphingomonas aracearum TaxID=2283317 RepID=UPI001EEF9A9A|nr:hypothetical protein [Sphingomonas aracearum]
MSVTSRLLAEVTIMLGRRDVRGRQLTCGNRRFRNLAGEQVGKRRLHNRIGHSLLQFAPFQHGQASGVGDKQPGVVALYRLGLAPHRRQSLVDHEQCDRVRCLFSLRLLGIRRRSTADRGCEVRVGGGRHQIFMARRPGGERLLDCRHSQAGLFDIGSDPPDGVARVDRGGIEAFDDVGTVIGSGEFVHRKSDMRRGEMEAAVHGALGGHQAPIGHRCRTINDVIGPFERRPDLAATFGRHDALGCVLAERDGRRGKAARHLPACRLQPVRGIEQRLPHPPRIWCAHDVQLVIARLTKGPVYGYLLPASRSLEGALNHLRDRRAALDAILDIFFGSDDWRSASIDPVWLGINMPLTENADPIIRRAAKQIIRSHGELEGHLSAIDVTGMMQKIAAKLRSDAFLARTATPRTTNVEAKSYATDWYGLPALAAASVAVRRLIQAEQQLPAMIDAVNGEKAGAVSDYHYREVRKKPLLMIHSLQPRDNPAVTGPVAAFGVSFPPGHYDKEIEVVANKVWLEAMQGTPDDPDEDEDYDA